MLKVTDLKKNFGQVKAVKGISFEVKKGEVLGFLGPNGAGKSTTMRMITGFLPPTDGRATVCGHDIVDAPVAAKRCIGYLPENAPCYENMTVDHFLSFTAELRGLRGAEKTDRLETAIRMCHLEKMRKRSVSTLSKGYRQRTCFAQAIIHDPPVLIMDEPTDGLDPNQKHVVREMITEMASEKAIIISTHILEEVDAVCTQAIIVADGAIVANGTPDELRGESPNHRLDEIFRTLTMPAEEANHG